MSIRIIRLQVPTNYDLEWAQSIREGTLNTSDGSMIWGVGDQFPTNKKGTVNENLLLVQLGPSFMHQAALDYAKQENKPHAHPRSIWAIGKKYPRLAKEQGESWMFLNSALTCTAHGYVYVPYLCCLEDGYRHAGVLVVQYGFLEASWFVFGE